MSQQTAYNPFDIVRRTITERTLLPPEGGLVLVGYSGGADSTALLHILTRLSTDLMIQVHALHLHHGMRPEANRDVIVCQSVCERLGVPLHVERVDVPALAKSEGITLEEAGRQARYAFFERMANELNAVAIATAHTRNDQIETILINLLRGTGPRGLCGMPYRHGRIIRPLLEVSREQTVAYCAQHQLPTVFDSTNVDPNQLRFRVRSQLIPLLQSLSPAFDRHLLKLAHIIENEEAWWDYYLHEQFGKFIAPHPEGERVSLPRELMLRLHPAVQRRLLREWIRGAVGTLHLPSYELLEGMRRALVEGRSTSWQITEQVRLLTNEDSVSLCRELPPEEPYEYPLQVGSPLLISQAGMWLEAEWVMQEGIGSAGNQETSLWEAYLDAEAIRGGLSVRTSRPGDRFQPLGMHHAKKVSRIFIDRKISPAWRKRLPLLTDEEGILWIPGYTIAERARITPETKRCLWVRLHRNAFHPDSSDSTEWNRWERLPWTSLPRE